MVLLEISLEVLKVMHVESILLGVVCVQQYTKIGACFVYMNESVAVFNTRKIMSIMQY